MAPEEVWSDSESDDEDLGEIETSVLLGLTDGPISSPEDLVDPAVSRLGGIPAFLPNVPCPSNEISMCKSCRKPMELLIQLWCPFESSPFDRVLYVWGCSRSGCQNKDGSVRAFRSIKFNERFAAKLEKKKEKERERLAEAKRIEAQKAASKAAPTANPFSMTATSNFGDSGMFGDGNLFEVPDSQSQSDTKQEPTQDGEDSDDDEPAVTEEEIKQLTAALQSSAIDDASDRSAWMSSPSYAPLYLSTSSEYIIPDPKKPPPKQSISANEPSGVGGGWGVEGYENAKGDEVFEKFAKRVANEGQQCVRYELSGAPLPFQSTDGVYKKLFPSRLPTMTTTGGRVGSVVTKGAFAVATSEEPTGKHVYDPSSIPSCPYCKGPRVFECQLMPNMISVLKRPSDGKQKKQSEVERRNELARVLLKQDTGGNKESGETTASQQLGMEWGTCFVFSCLNDCALEDGSKEVKSCWREEIVMVQWET